MQGLLVRLSANNSQLQEGLRDLLGTINWMDWTRNEWVINDKAQWSSRVGNLGLTIALHHSKGVLTKGQSFTNLYMKVSMYDLTNDESNSIIKKFNEYFRGRLTIYLNTIEDYQKAISVLKEIQQYG